MNCQIKKVIVSISSLGSTFSGDHLTVHVYASNEAEKLLVGRLDFVGKTLSGFKHLLTVICPDGFELSAIAVDELGVPHPFNDRWGIAVADYLYFPRGGFLTPEKAMSKELSGAAGDVLHADKEVLNVRHLPNHANHPNRRNLHGQDVTTSA